MVINTVGRMDYKNYPTECYYVKTRQGTAENKQNLET